MENDQVNYQILAPKTANVSNAGTFDNLIIKKRPIIGTPSKIKMGFVRTSEFKLAFYQIGPYGQEWPKKLIIFVITKVSFDNL